LWPTASCAQFCHFAHRRRVYNRPMSYKYQIMRVDEELSIDVQFAQPIPHLAVGNSLVISNEHLHLLGGHHFVVRHIETFIEARQPPVANLLVIVVHVEMVDRAKSPVARH
jgi:hypothetical protein